jgi:polar amino acid transport system substrate-binding protein
MSAKTDAAMRFVIHLYRVLDHFATIAAATTFRGTIMTPRSGSIVLLCCTVLLGLSPGLRGAAIAAEPIRLTTSELPPLSMEHRPGQPGALVEMVEELARRTGSRTTIEFVPWRRAVQLTTARPRSAVFPLTRSPERETQYRWLAPLYRETFVFLSWKGSKFDLARPERSRQQRIGILRGSLMIKHLREHGYPNIVEASSVQESLRFLRRGIVDAVFGNGDIYRASLGARGASDYAMSPAMRETATWLGGSLDFAESDAARFGQAMKAMVDDGTHARILKKYQLDQAQ